MLGEDVFVSVILTLQKTPVIRETACLWTDHPPVIDGKLTEDLWFPAPGNHQLRLVHPDGQKHATGSTCAGWPGTNNALYYAAKMSDRELRSAGEKRNDRLGNGDAFELFFKPSEERPEYYEFEVNPKSLVLELAFPHRGVDPNTFAASPPLGMQAVVSLNGTINDAGDVDKSWTVEGFIPWSAFAPSGGRPKPGANWKFALCRYDYGAEGTVPVLMSTAPLAKPNFHRYEDYGLLRFEGPLKTP